MGWPNTTEDYKHIEQVCSWPSPTLRDWIRYWKDQIKWYEDFTEEKRQVLEAQLNRDRPEFGGPGEFKFADNLAYYRQIVRIGQDELARRRRESQCSKLTARAEWFRLLSFRARSRR